MTPQSPPASFHSTHITYHIHTQSIPIMSCATLNLVVSFIPGIKARPHFSTIHRILSPRIAKLTCRPCRAVGGSNFAQSTPAMY